MLQAARAAGERVFEFSIPPRNARATSAASAPEPVRGEVRYEKVGFGYAGGPDRA